MKPTILIIDDEDSIREFYFLGLKDRGFSVLAAKNGLDGLKLAKTKHPGVVVLDVVMPGLAGLQLFKEVRKRVPAAPVVVMSGYSADQAVISLLEAGARELIQKPFTLETLASAIRRAVAQEEKAKGGASARL